MPVDTYVNTGMTAGTEVSSGGEGRVLTFEESVLVHPYHADGFVDGKDPVRYDNIVGVALKGAAAATDMIAIDTEGIFWLNVLGSVSDGTDDGLAQELSPGTPIYIKKTPGTDVYILSGQHDPNAWQLFGYTLSTVTSSLTVPTLVAVKVHWNPSPIDNDRVFGIASDGFDIVSGRYGRQVVTRVTSGASEGLAGYWEGHIAGTTTGHTYNFGSWINVDESAVLAAGHIIVPYEGGVYTSEAQATARIVFAGQHQAILTGAPASLYAWRLNSTQDITALIAFANPGTAGYQAGTAGTGVSGTIPIADIVGTGVVYIDVHAAVA